MQKVKSLIIISVLFGFSCSTALQREENKENTVKILNKDRQSKGLYGNVKSVDQYLVHLSTNKKMNSFFMEFNEYGILISNHNKSEKYIDILDITCDSKGFPVSGARETKNTQDETKIYNYSYVCSATGLVVVQKTTTDIMELTSNISYNIDGFETSRRNFNSGLLSSLDTTEYYEDNRIKRYAHLNPETLEPTYEVLTIYLGDMKESIETWYTNGNPIRSIKRIEQLDDFGNPTLSISISGEDSTKFNSRYIYDDQNNWIEKFGYKGDSLVAHWKRDIIYY